jgi:hypothetical protein
VSAHTPGPWAVFHDHPDPDTAACRGSIRPADNSLPKCYASEIAGVYLCELPEQAANALLIAAAPEMLAVLLELVDLEGPQPGNSAWAQKARAAITKATGTDTAASEFPSFSRELAAFGALLDGASLEQADAA